MKVQTIKDMVRKDVPIYYRRLYTGVAVMELSGKLQDFRIDFTIEQKPTGINEVTVSFIDTVDYPVIPLTKELKEFIGNLDTNGALPD